MSSKILPYCRVVDLYLVKRLIDWLPIPFSSFNFGDTEPGMKKAAGELKKRNALCAFSHRPVKKEQIVCALSIGEIGEDFVEFVGLYRVKILDILKHNGKTAVIKGEILDYRPELLRPITDEYADKYIEPIRELCRKSHEYDARIFPEDIFDNEKLGSVDEFLDRVFAALQVYFLDDAVYEFGRILLDASTQESYLTTVDVRRRAELLFRILASAVRYFAEYDNFQWGNIKPFVREKNKGSQDAVTVPVKKKEAPKHPYERYVQMMREAGVPEEAKEEAASELPKLLGDPRGEEFRRASRYIEWLCALPWNKSTKDNLDLKDVGKILDRDHFGLKPVKERIKEYLAVQKLITDKKLEPQGSILCFIGPPGTGKTSIGRSIAKAMGRKYIRLALGGIKDEDDLRGHGRVYVGALPGRIISSLKKAGANNPVFMLDEIDKVGNNRVSGDPESALMEILDPEQNNSFVDHYLNTPFDLSKVLFIATANSWAEVSGPLLDRLEVIKFEPYTPEEKFKIARKYLIGKQIEKHGLGSSQIIVTDRAIKGIISGYTREAGVRNLEKEIMALCRKTAAAIVSGEGTALKIADANLPKHLGPRKYRRKKLGEEFGPGIAVGLAWTPAGGEVLLIETRKLIRNSFDKPLKVTGRLQEVMKESIDCAMTLVESYAGKLHVKKGSFEKHKIHLHIPEGAIKKDGPSAGVTITVALASLLTNKPVRKNLAMTGEITLCGAITPVGGLKEKISAGAREGIKEFIVPEDNRHNIAEFSSDYKGVKFHFVKNIEEVFKIVFKK